MNPQHPAVPARTFWIRITDDSMTTPENRSFEIGNDVLFDPDREPTPGRFVLAECGTGRHFGRLARTGDQWQLERLNPAYPPLTIAHLSDICGVATMSGHSV